MSLPRWDFFVDTGGTFTDCLARSESGEFYRAKILSQGSLSAEVAGLEGRYQLTLSSDPDWPKCFVNGLRITVSGHDSFHARITSWEPDSLRLKVDKNLPDSITPGTTLKVDTPWEAPILGMKLIMARLGLSMEEVRVRIRLATTRCTNTLLENKGEKPILFVTSGFADLLEIGDQRRTELFDLIPQKRRTLTREVVEVDERLDHQGKVLRSPNLQEVKKQAEQILRKGSKIAAVSFLHSYLNPAHEQKVAQLLRQVGLVVVIESSGLYPFIK